MRLNQRVSSGWNSRGSVDLLPPVYSNKFTFSVHLLLMQVHSIPTTEKGDVVLYLAGIFNKASQKKQSLGPQASCQKGQHEKAQASWNIS